MSVTVKGKRILYELDAWGARQLSYILDREGQPLKPGGMPDTGWLEDSRALFEAADQVEGVSDAA